MVFFHELMMERKKVNIWLLDARASKGQRTWYEGVIIMGIESGFIKIMFPGTIDPIVEAQTYWIRMDLISEVQVL